MANVKPCSNAFEQGFIFGVMKRVVREIATLRKSAKNEGIGKANCE